MGMPVQRSRAKTCAPCGISNTGNSSPFSQTMGSVAWCTSVRLCTRTGSFRERRKPNMSARGDSPSRIRTAPRSTRVNHSTLAAAPVRATKIRDTPAGWRWKPMDPRIWGHAPASSESTLKYGRSAARATQAKTTKKARIRTLPNGRGSDAKSRSADDTLRATSVREWLLPGKRIPESGAKVVEGPAARWVVDQIRAAQQVERQVHGLRQGDPQSGPRLHEIRPILAFGVDGDVAVPVELNRAEIVAGSGLRVGQKIVIETAHVERIQGGLGQPRATLAMQPARHR